MLAEVRAAVYGLIDDAGIVPVWNELPDDISELPCVVVGRPVASQTSTSVVYDIVLEVSVIGRRQSAGGAEDELTALTDQVWTLFRGTRGIKHLGLTLAVRNIWIREELIANQRYPAYVLSVESSIATC